MPRSNRPRGRKPQSDEEADLARALQGRLHTESRRDGEWNVQSITTPNALKSYTCPGCGLEIAPGVAHIVAWRADGLFGESRDIEARRHWHSHCWRITA